MLPDTQLLFVFLFLIAFACFGLGFLIGRESATIEPLYTGRVRFGPTWMPTPFRFAFWRPRTVDITEPLDHAPFPSFLDVLKDGVVVPEAVVADLTYTSSDPSIFTVDANGVVGLVAVGVATETVTGNYTAPSGKVYPLVATGTVTVTEADGVLTGAVRFGV